MRTRLGRWIALLLVLAGVSAYATGLYYSGTTAATDVNTAVSFTDNRSGGSNAAFKATHVVVWNDGPNSVHVDLGDTTATTADRKIKAGESFSEDWDARLGSDGWPGLGLICAAGETASVRVWADR